jgi:hypothetical protein
LEGYGITGLRMDKMAIGGGLSFFWLSNSVERWRCVLSGDWLLRDCDFWCIVVASSLKERGCNLEKTTLKRGICKTVQE